MSEQSTHTLRSEQSSVRYASLDFFEFPDYRVGDDGSVWSRRKGRWGTGMNWKQLKASDRGDGYRRVTLYLPDGRSKFFLVQHLVLEAFVGPRPAGLLGLHKDGDRGNNFVGNLYWGTYSDNVKDSIRHGTHFTPFRGNLVRRRRKFSDEEVAAMFRLREEGLTFREIARQCGASFGYVGRILRGENGRKPC